MTATAAALLRSPPPSKLSLSLRSLARFIFVFLFACFVVYGTATRQAGGGDSDGRPLVIVRICGCAQRAADGERSVTCSQRVARACESGGLLLVACSVVRSCVRNLCARPHKRQLGCAQYQRPRRRAAQDPTATGHAGQDNRKTAWRRRKLHKNGNVARVNRVGRTR